jgi:hypothetical protein
MALSLAPVTVTYVPGSAAPLPQGANGTAFTMASSHAERADCRAPS